MNPTPHDGPAQQPAADSGKRRRRLLLGGLIAGLVVLLLLGFWIASLAGAFETDAESAAPDRENAASTATAFVERYAVHDPAACELATPELRAQLARDGRCGGGSRGTIPRVVKLTATTCGTRASFSASVDPSGEVGKRFVTVSMEQLGPQWAARSVLPVSDRKVIRPYACAPPSTEYGG